MQVKSLRAMLLGAAFGVLALAPMQANAQIQVQATYDTDFSQVGFGAGYNFGLGGLTEKNGISAVATFDYYLKKNYSTLWEANVNGKMDVGSVPGLYVGAGAGIHHWGFDYDNGYCGLVGINCSSSSSDFQINALGGWNFSSKKSGPFVEARLAFGNGSSLKVGGGIRF